MGGKLVAVLVSVALVCSSSGVIDAGPSGGALPPELTQVIEIAGNHGVPDDAEMVAVNVTAITPGAAGHLTTYACDRERPNASTLNYGPGDVVPNLALVRIADDGTICIATHAVTDLVVDVVGYVPAGSGISSLDTPQRLADTRILDDPIEAGSHREIDLGNIVADDSTLAMFNLTGVLAEDHGHATVYPCTADVPNTSSLNYVPGRTVANIVTARLSSEQSVCVYSHATSHFVVDVVAFADEGIVTMDEPRRVFDSRRTSGPVEGNTVVRLDVADQPGVPGRAAAAVYNLTAAAPAAPGHATSYPCDEKRPEASNLNYRPGLTAANGAITKLSPKGELCIHVHATTDLIVDLVGYTDGIGQYVPLTPTRALDTRTGWRPVCDLALATSPVNGPRLVDRSGATVRQFAVDEIPATGEVDIHPDCESLIYLDVEGVRRFDWSTDRRTTISRTNYEYLNVLGDGTIVGYRREGHWLTDRQIGEDVLTREPIVVFQPDEEYYEHVWMRPPGSQFAPMLSDDRSVFAYRGEITHLATGEVVLIEGSQLSPSGSLVLGPARRATAHVDVPSVLEPTITEVKCDVMTSWGDDVTTIHVRIASFHHVYPTCSWAGDGSVMVGGDGHWFLVDLFGRVHAVLGGLEYSGGWSLHRYR